MASKRLYEEAFERKKLQSVKIQEFYVEHTVYKVLKQDVSSDFSIQTAENCKFLYDESVILQTATSATMYTCEKKATKTELIELFSNLSINDIWFALYYTKDTSWQEKFVEKIQSMDKVTALKFVKKDFAIFGKRNREMVGQKMCMKTDNNYYTVRDLNIHFDELTNCKPEIAAKKSIRKLDVNTLQCLIFNGVKYMLK